MFGLDGLIGGAFNYFGTKDTNETNIQLAAENRAFNAEQAELSRTFSAEQASKAMGFSKAMSNTGYRRATHDMEEAGLNPMLAFSQGGASSPSGVAGSSAAASGQAARVESPMSAAVATALQANLAKAQIDKLEAETERVEAETETERERPANVRQETQLSSARMTDINERLRVMMPQEHAKLASEIILNGTRDRLTYEEFKHEFEKAKLTRVETQQALLLIPRMKNEAAAEDSWIKKHLSPWMRDFIGGSSSAGSIDRIFRRR